MAVLVTDQISGKTNYSCHDKSVFSNERLVNPPCVFDTKTTVEACRNYTHKYDTVWKYGEIIKSGLVTMQDQQYFHKLNKLDRNLSDNCTIIWLLRNSMHPYSKMVRG